MQQMSTEPTDVSQDDHSTRIAFKRRVRLTTNTSIDGDSFDSAIPDTMNDDNDDMCRRQSEISLSTPDRNHLKIEKNHDEY